jgi:hypothetical protein
MPHRPKEPPYSTIIHPPASSQVPLHHHSTGAHRRLTCADRPARITTKPLGGRKSAKPAELALERLIRARFASKALKLGQEPELNLRDLTVLTRLVAKKGGPGTAGEARRDSDCLPAHRASPAGAARRGSP